ncbi:MAG: S8 family serine peptidase [Defluviitaleaceae bacterium]|nr:S8 family serine peptidase [Defluviitaleaceae bacterium]
MRRKTGRIISFLIALLMIFATPAVHGGELNAVIDILPHEHEAFGRDGLINHPEMEYFSYSRRESMPEIQGAREHSGLIGFEGEYVLGNDNSPVGVIVLFQSGPAEVQVVESQMDGQPVTPFAAEKIAEDDHVLFRQELNALFGVTGQEVQPMSQNYEIRWEYRRAINGVSLTLPSDMVAELADFKSVRAVFPNPLITIEPFEEISNITTTTPQSINISPPGMAPGRATMRADEMHALGYRGKDVLIAVIDTGINYTHPALADAFPSLEEMQSRNPNITERDTINGIFYGRNFYWDSIPLNDPNESINRTNHGTHVAGTIAGRDTGEDVAILGVAPEAKVISYRVLGPDNSGPLDVVLAAIDKTAHDRPDIVNMSLGTDLNSPVCILALAVNNIMLAHPNITFTISAGNSGRHGFYTVGTPASATMAITVGSAALSPTETDEYQIELSDFSSTGPVNDSYEIKPDIIAHGSNVLSAVPNWSSQTGYSHMSGTSMSAPHIAGAVALLVEYSRKNNGTAWNSEEIKTRLMNTTIPMEGYGVFETGAGYADVFAAAFTDTVVFINYNQVVIHPDAFDVFDFMATSTGSLSFGEHTILADDPPQMVERTLSASINNFGSDERQYTLAYEFKKNPNDAASLSFSGVSENILIGAGETAAFNVTISAASKAATSGFYEGFVYVKSGTETVAALPFAFVLKVEEPPVFTRTHIPDGFVGFSYWAGLSVRSLGPITDFKIIAGELPPGLFLHHSESRGDIRWLDIEGFPEATGTFPLTLRVENAAGFIEEEFIITVRNDRPDSPVIITTELPGGEVGEWYSAYIEIRVGDIDQIAAGLGGRLPPGLNIFRNWTYEDGYLYFYIEGIPTENGIWSFVFAAATDFGATEWVYFTILIGDDSHFVDITDSFECPNFLDLVRRSFATPDRPVYDVDVVNRTVLIADNRYITSLAGIEHFTALRDFRAMSNLLTDADFSNNHKLETAVLRLNFLTSLDVSSNPDLWWLVVNENFITHPDDVIGWQDLFDDVGEEFGFWFLEQRTPTPPALNIDNPPSGCLGVSYYAPLRASGTSPFNWSVTEGSLPPGLFIANDTREPFFSESMISGIPTEIGTFTFTVTAENQWGSDSQELTITINYPEPPVIVSSELENGSVGDLYQETLIAESTTPFMWIITAGSLPTGLTFNRTRGEIIGTPSAMGEFTFTITAMNAWGSDSQEFTIKIGPQFPPIIDGISFPAGIQGSMYNENILLSQGSKPLTWSITEGNLPPGLNLHRSSGNISGISTETGEFTFTVRVENGAGFDTKQFTITMYPIPTFNWGAFPFGGVGIFYHQTFTMFGSPPITWSIISGSLPPGLTLGGNPLFGEISGTPTEVGTFTFTIEAQSRDGFIIRREHSITIFDAQPPVIVATNIPDGAIGVSYDIRIRANSNVRTEPWSLISGSLPPGLTWSSSHISNGTQLRIWGRPTTPGEFTVTFKVENIAGYDTVAFTINVPFTTDLLRNELALRIKYAEELLCNTVVSEDGSNVLLGNYWVTLHEYELFQAAISAAWEVYNETGS